MKRDRVCILVLSLLALAAPCFAQSGPEHQPNSIKPPQATPAKKSAGKNTKAAAASADDLEARERQIIEALKRGDYQAFSDSLTDDAVELTSNGLASKAQILEAVKSAKLIDYTMTEMKVTPLDKDASVVTYRTTGKYSAGGQEGTYDNRASTVWVKRGGKWLAIFHQEMPNGHSH